ncbi:cutinase family protein [Nocardia sp. alder85J]|uniref:cutinase family protein n=1 Tax=Nocardia sp. alder85J TaxID=2862949 RepID=UPI001CD334FC|nr:cutinase family protein [Nocardia sp. alder85J]MCX4099089.1 cutinase family protein [Nocardia sp. alder85J]
MTARTVRAAALGMICAAVATVTVVVFAPAAAGDDAAGTCPDIHVLAVAGTTESSVNAPSDDDTGELSAAIIPALNTARAEGLRIERTYIAYPADFGSQGLATAYKASVIDGYNRLTQVAARVVYQCPTTKLVLLGYSQGGHAVSMLAQQIGAGKTGPITAGDIALVATFGDPTRGPDAALFPGRPGQQGPAPWPGTDRKTRPSATKFPDMYDSPKGEGIGPARDIAASFGALDDRTVQWCLSGDLACSAPKSISLAKVALDIAGQSNLDFTHDPFGVVTSLAAATANTFAGGTATFMDKDVRGHNLADMYFDGSASISKRLEAAADPRNADQQTNPLVALLKSGQMIMSSVTTFVGSVLNPAVLGSLINAGVQIAGSAATGAITAGVPALAGGPAAAVAAAGAGAATGAAAGLPGLVTPVISIVGNTATAALNIMPPQSAEKKISSIFDLLINEVKANQDLPQLLTDARLWNQQATHGGYRTARVALDGSTPTDITADWITAAARDLRATRAKDEAKKNPPTSTPNTTTATSGKPAPVVNAHYDRDTAGNVVNPVGPPLGNAPTAPKTETPGDVRITTNGPTPPQVPAKVGPLVWVADGTASIATRLAATDPATTAGALLHIGSPLLAASPAQTKQIGRP